MHPKQDRHIEVIGTGTPPQLEIRTLVDEVLGILDQRPGRSGGAIDERDPDHDERTLGAHTAQVRLCHRRPFDVGSLRPARWLLRPTR
jgi:hypothetical protein